MTEWSTDTDYDPGRDTNSPNDIFVDGRLPTPCGVTNWGTALAVTCYTYQNRTGTDEDYVDGPYRRLIDADIYMNMEVAASPDWWIGSGQPPESDRYHFKGILTHELGHTVYLNDLYASCTGRHNSTDWYTMCGTYSGNDDSYWSRTLHADDKAAANLAYP